MPGYVVGRPVERDTGDSWALVAEIPSAEFDEVTLIVKNVHQTNSLDYRVTVLVYPGGVEYEEVPQTTLEPGKADKKLLTGRYYRVRVYAKNANTGTPSRIRVEWIAGGRR